MVTEVANSVPAFHVKFECSGTGGGCAAPDAKKRSVEANSYDFLNGQSC